MRNHWKCSSRNHLGSSYLQLDGGKICRVEPSSTSCTARHHSWNITFRYHKWVGCAVRTNYILCGRYPTHIACSRSLCWSTLSHETAWHTVGLTVFMPRRVLIDCHPLFYMTNRLARLRFSIPPSLIFGLINTDLMDSTLIWQVCTLTLSVVLFNELKGPMGYEVRLYSDYTLIHLRFIGCFKQGFV